MAVNVDHVHLFIKNVSQKCFVVLQNVPLAGLRSGEGRTGSAMRNICSFCCYTNV
jgi:hypothetical protein